MIGFWWFENDTEAGMALVGISGICGLVGSSIFVPIKNRIEKMIESFSLDSIKKIVRKITSEDNEPTE